MVATSDSERKEATFLLLLTQGPTILPRLATGYWAQAVSPPQCPCSWAGPWILMFSNPQVP